MRILILTQYYPPEVGATQNRMHFFASRLAARGHAVTVITAVPNHPAGVIHPDYADVWYRSTHEDGVRIIRVRVRTSPTKTFWSRIGFYFSFATAGTLAAFLLARRRYQVVFATSPPLTVGVPGCVYALMRRVPFVLDVRDLWPELAIQLGELRNTFVIRLARSLEAFLYRSSSRITVVTRAFARDIESHGYPKERIVFLPNGTVPEIFHPVARDPDLIRTLGLQDCFVVGFFGNHGIAQNLEGVVDAAARLAHDDRFRFLFVGEGPVKAALMEKQAAIGLRNVIFHPQVPQATVVRYIALCDVLVVPLRNMSLLEGFIPSKLFDFMACAKPILLQVAGEAREVLEEAGAGVFVPPGDAEALSNAVRQMALLTPPERQHLGEAGLAYVRKHRLREHQAERLHELLTTLVADPGVATGADVCSPV